MMGKFTPQLKELPGTVDLTSPSALGESRPAASLPPRAEEDHLRAAQALLERELSRADLSPQEAEALREVLFGLRERNMQRVNLVYRDAFREIRNLSDNLRRVREHLDAHFEKGKGRPADAHLNS
jgi:hypothetical protein